MATISSNNQTPNAFPYALQPQPPPHPKTTGGKRGPSAPIAIPTWPGGDDSEDDSDNSITDHTPPSQSGRLANLDMSFSNSPSSTAAVYPSTRGATVVYVSNQISSPRGLSTTKKLGTGISSPRTLFNNNNAVTLNLNHSVSSSTPATVTSTPITTPILIIHPTNSNKASVSETHSSNHTSNNTSSTSLPVSGSNLFAATNPIPANGNGLTTSHPPAPWVTSQTSGSSGSNIANIIGTSSKHANLATAQTTLSKVPRLVENPIQPKEQALGLSVKGQKGLDNHLPVCSSLSLSDSFPLNQNSLSATNSQPVHAQVTNKVTNNSNNTLVVGIPENTTAPKSDTAGATTLQLSPSEASSDGDPRGNSPVSSSSNSCFAYELDHDYENVASPCSSTASGPTYVRQPGFRHHAHEVTLPAGGTAAGTASSSSSSSGANASLFSASLSPSGNGGLGSSNAFRLKKKKCSAMLVNFREGFKKREATPPKLKPKRGMYMCITFRFDQSTCLFFF